MHSPFFLMKSPLSIAVLMPVLALSACFTSTATNNGQSSVQSMSSAPMQETRNVTYQGTLQAAGASIFMEGTHKLQLEDGRFIMLQSTDVDLDEYVGSKVELFGSVRPTVEAGGMIMRVERIASREASSVSSVTSSGPSRFTGATVTYIGTVEQSSDGSCMMQIRGKNTSVTLIMSECSQYDSKTMEITGTLGSINGGTDNAVDVTAATEIKPVSSAALSVAASSVRSVTVSSAAVSSAAPVISSSAAPAASSAPFEASTELTEKAAIMAKDNMAASFWTQQYCTKTAAYCIAIHKNWYFTSFGATSTTLWHLEVGPQEINNIGEGPLSVNLVSGSTSMDGQVKAEAGGVVGYKEWTNNRHFEIRGPSNLQTAITYMLGTLKPNDQ